MEVQTYESSGGRDPVGEYVESQDFKTKNKIVKFSIRQKEANELKKVLKIPGQHNVSNALAALNTARILGISDKITLKALGEYKGVWRRFEVSKFAIGNLQLPEDLAPGQWRWILPSELEKYFKA